MCEALGNCNGNVGSLEKEVKSQPFPTGGVQSILMVTQNVMSHSLLFTLFIIFTSYTIFTSVTNLTYLTFSKQHQGFCSVL